MSNPHLNEAALLLRGAADVVDEVAALRSGVIQSAATEAAREHVKRVVAAALAELDRA